MTPGNYIQLIGRPGRDPVLRPTADGEPMVTLSLATNVTYRDREGQRQQRTEWHNVVAFGRRAETLHRYLRKGRLVQIVGQMRYRKWTDDYGQNRTTAQVVVDDFNFLSPAANDAASEEPASSAPTLARPPAGSAWPSAHYSAATTVPDPDAGLDF